MPRKGRDLELLVSPIERALVSTAATVHSPLIVKDKITGQPREADIGIMTKVGDHEILVLVECRDRKAKSDVTWIESLPAKAQALGAHKIIAVSTLDLTEPARLKAAAFGIEFRRVSEVSLEDVQQWCAAKGITIFKRRVRILSTTLESFGEGEAEAIEIRKWFELAKPKPTEPILLIGKTNVTVSILTAWNRCCPQERLWESFVQPTKRTVRLQFVDPADPLFLLAGDRRIKVKAIRFEIEQWVDSEMIPFKAPVQYATSEGTRVEYLEVELTDLPEPITFSVVRDSAGESKVVVQASSLSASMTSDCRKNS